MARRVAFLPSKGLFFRIFVLSILFIEKGLLGEERQSYD